MRAFLIWLASFMPPSHVTDRIAPISAVLVAGLAGFWTVFQYSDRLTIDRVKAGFAMHEQYRAAFGPGGIRASLPSRLDHEVLQRQTTAVKCRFLVAAGLLAEPPEGCGGIDPQGFAVLEKAVPALDDAQRKALRDQIEAAQAAEAWVPEEELKLEAILGFFHAVSICIDENACDPETTLALFRREMIVFLNAVCGKLATNPVNKSVGSTIARVIRDVDGAHPPEWTTDAQRRQQFLCDWLREADAI